MAKTTTKDGAEIFYKDWGPKDAQPIMFHHGWPLSSDDWDAQMLYSVQKGYRVVAHDRRGHGRSSQVSEGHDIPSRNTSAAQSPRFCCFRQHRLLLFAEVAAGSNNNVSKSALLYCWRDVDGSCGNFSPRLIAALPYLLANPLNAVYEFTT